MPKQKLCIGTPMYGGLATGTYIESIMALQRLCQEKKLDLDLAFTYNESLITRARNRVTDQFMKLSNATHLLWCDADIGFNPSDIIAMIDADKDIIGAACVKKSINWGRIQEFLKKHNEIIFTPQQLMDVSGDFVVQFLPSVVEQQINLSAPIEVKRLGTGLLLVKRKVFLKIKEAFPDRYYNQAGDPAALPGPIPAYFESRVDPESRQYLSEDYAFCDDARSLGMEVWLAPWVKTTHSGMFKFEGDMVAVALGMGQL